MIQGGRVIVDNREPLMSDRLWPKAAIRTESKSVFLNGCFGEKQTLDSLS